jgi:hypothetical protein
LGLLTSQHAHRCRNRDLHRLLPAAPQAQLEAAQEAAKAAEEKALDTVRSANEETTQRSQEAAQMVANDSMSIVAAARVSPYSPPWEPAPPAPAWQLPVYCGLTPHG